MSDPEIEFSSVRIAPPVEQMALRAATRRALSEDVDALRSALIYANLEVWLDPRLPLLLLGNPGMSPERVLSEAAFRAGRKIARGFHLVNRTPVRGKDDYTCLKAWLKVWWERYATAEGARLARWPWDCSFAALDPNRGFLVMDQRLMRSALFGEQVRELVSITLSALAPLVGRKQGSNQNYDLHKEAQRLTEFYYLADARFSDLTAYGRLVQSGAPFASLVGWQQENLFTELRATLERHGIVWSDEAVAHRLKEPHTHCPLLQYFPEQDVVPYAAYFDMEHRLPW